MKGLHDIERQHPEWRPWLAVLAPVLDEMHNRAWDDAVPAPATPINAAAPLLASAPVRCAPALVSGLVARLLRSALLDAPPATVAAEKFSGDVFDAGLNGDDEQFARLAASVRMEPEALGTVAALVPVPFLHACHRRWASAVPKGWAQGYCPVCGAWPSFAEECGVERARYLRCARCGAAWESACLLCAFCGMTDHASLGSLVEDQGKAAVEVCGRCQSYLKVFTVLRPIPAHDVMLNDLAPVALDLAALPRGFSRPPGAGYRLNAVCGQMS
jgi:FdhE protein